MSDQAFGPASVEAGRFCDFCANHEPGEACCLNRPTQRLTLMPITLDELADTYGSPELYRAQLQHHQGFPGRTL